MLRAVICKGDRTSHGGEVIEGDDTCTTDGRAITRRGHMTFCPQCKGKFPIDDGIASFMFGDSVVVDGMRAACGATIIASQHAMLIDDGAGEGASQPPKTRPRPRTATCSPASSSSPKTRAYPCRVFDTASFCRTAAAGKA
jgi:uncharacterized Zn-binding protein involved in type VI secretion